MIKTLLFGACGRMGRLTAEVISSTSDIKLVAGIERKDHPEMGSTLFGVKIISDQMEFPKADVWIDFSLHEPALKHIHRASEKGTPFIMAVTGFSAEEEREIKKISKRIPVVWAPNLSMGAAVLERLSTQAAVWLRDDFEATLVDVHHKMKRDAPSGTAKHIAQSLEELGVVPQIVSLRGGGAVGEHQIRFLGSDEEVVLIHRVWSRRAFAVGVLKAVRFIVDQPPNLYSPRDIFSE